jgi:Spy/CpxP family protein refolding chaperone
MKSLRMLGVVASLGSLVVLSVLAVLAVLAAPVGAEPGHGHRGGDHGGDRLERKVDRMQERLGLSDEQADEVTAIFQEAHQNGKP